MIAIYVAPLRAQSSKGVNLGAMQGWDIVVDEDAIASEMYAAEEFQEFFSQASGVKLPVVRKIDGLDRHVFIGPSQAMRLSNVGFSIDDFGEEDLRIVVRGGNVAIAGGRPRGTLYGVYTFLEDYLGVRFLTHDHTHVPAVGEQRMIGPVDRVYRPPFADCRYTGYESPHRHPVFAVRTRNNPIQDEERFGGVPLYVNINHSFHAQLPTKKYGKDLPEYFCMVGGKRIADPGSFSNPCYAHPDVLRIVTEYILHRVDKVKRSSHGVAQVDSAWKYCQCPECAAIDKREGSHMGALLNFVNKVADEVAKTHPQAFVGTLSYDYSAKPPRTIKPRDNVQINFCSESACMLHRFADPNCPRNVEHMKNLRGWSRICKNLYAWTYNINFADPLVPHPNLHTIKPNIKTLLDHGVKGVFMQCAGGGLLAAEMSELRNYLISRLLWNPDLDDKALINEFLDLHYGKVAPPIRRFLDITYRHYRDTGLHLSLRDNRNLPIDRAIAQIGLDLFNQAMKFAENDKIKTRVEKASLCAYRAALDPVCNIAKDKINPVLANKMLPRVRRFFHLCDTYGISPNYINYYRHRLPVLGLQN